MLHHLSADVTPLSFRQALGTFATGVTVVTTERSDGSIHAMTANAFCSLSLSPPLVLIAVSCHSRMHDLLQQSGHFGISILAQEQRTLADHFAGKHQQDLAISFERAHGYPLIPGAIAQLLCSIATSYVEGDHCLFIGQVTFLHTGTTDDQFPLLFYRGKYTRVAQEGERSLP